MSCPTSHNSPAMTLQQKKFSPTSGGGIRRYRELVVGRRGWGIFILWEIYSLLLADCASILGYALRRTILPLFMAKCGKALTIGRGCVIRQPHSLRVGDGAIIEDYATLDIRSTEQEASISLGNHIFIGRGTIIAAKGGKIELGDACNISSNCRIATQTSVHIGQSVLVAAYAYIGPGNHRTDRLDIPIMEQEMELKGGVEIGTNSWIGAHSTILDGVKIGTNAIIGAHSLVMQNVPDNAIVAGIPAKVIRMRSEAAVAK